MSDIRNAHDVLRQHAEETGDTALEKALHSFAVSLKWEDPSAAEIANKIHP